MLRTALKPLSLIGAILLLAACGGGGGGGDNGGGGSSSTGSSSSPTTGSTTSNTDNANDCLRIDADTKYTFRFTDTTTGQTSDAEVETFNTTYKGTQVLAAKQTETINTTDGRSIYQICTNYIKVFSDHLEALGSESYVTTTTKNPSAVTREYAVATFTPPQSTPRAPVNWKNSSTVNATITNLDTRAVSTYSNIFSETGEFLGYESVTLGDGRVLNNACKFKVTTAVDGSQGATMYHWYAAGWGLVKLSATYSSAIIQKVTTAPK